MLIIYRNKKDKENATGKLNRYMENHKPVIRPYGELRKHGHGYKIWGEQTINGKVENNLYYADTRCVAKWRGNAVGWMEILKIDGRTKSEKLKKANIANIQMQQTRNKALLSK